MDNKEPEEIRGIEEIKKHLKETYPDVEDDIDNIVDNFVNRRKNNVEPEL